MVLSDLRRRILEDSRVLEGGIISVDSFLNHQLDVDLCVQIGKALSDHFKDLQPTVVLTVEASGIVPAFLVAQNLNIRLIIARKKRSLAMGERYTCVRSFSHTRHEPIYLYLNQDYIHKDDRVLIIDDFLANGNVALGVINLVTSQNVPVVGAGFVVEKSYLLGRSLLEQYEQISTFSLLRVQALENSQIILQDEDDS